MFPEMSSAITWVHHRGPVGSGPLVSVPASAATGPEGLWSLLAAPHSCPSEVSLLAASQDTPPRSPGPHRDGGFPSIPAESQHQWASHFLLGHDLENKRARQASKRKRTPLALLLSVPPTPQPLAAFLPVSELATRLLSLLGLLICLWCTHIPRGSPEGDAFRHQPSTGPHCTWPDSAHRSWGEKPVG